MTAARRSRRLVEQYADGGGSLLVCPICFGARKLDEGELVANARSAAQPPSGSGSAMSGATVFSY